MPHSPRSPWRPVRVVEGGTEKRAGRCFACERFLGTEPVKGNYGHQAEPVTIAGTTLPPGWYCLLCLERAKRAD